MTHIPKWRRPDPRWRQEHRKEKRKGLVLVSIYPLSPTTPQGAGAQEDLQPGFYPLPPPSPLLALFFTPAALSLWLTALDGSRF